VADFTNDFSVNLGDYAHVHAYDSASSATVSGGECAIAITGNDAGNTGQSWIEIDDVDITSNLSVFIEVRQDTPGGCGFAQTCVLGVAKADEIIGQSGFAAFQIAPDGSPGSISGKKGRYDNGVFSGTSYTTNSHGPMWVWLYVAADGTITIKYKESLSGAWVLLPQTNTNFNLSGETKCKLGYFATAANTYSHTVYLNYVTDTDPTPAPITATGLWVGFAKFEGFTTW